MPLSPNVTLRLDVEAIRYQVVHAFIAHTKEVSGEIDRAIEAEIKDFDFMAIVKAEVQVAFARAIKQAIADACTSIMYESPLREIIKDGAATKVREAIEKSLT